MGQMHFDQMYENAIDLDRRAVLTALDLGLGDTWFNHGLDERMVIARRLDEMNGDFLTTLREMVCAGKCTPRLRNPMTGEAIWVKDPAAFGFDEEQLSVEQFHHILGQG